MQTSKLTRVHLLINDGTVFFSQVPLNDIFQINAEHLRTGKKNTDKNRKLIFTGAAARDLLVI